MDGKPRNFGSEHFSTSPNFYYLDILLSLKYLNLAPLGGGGAKGSPCGFSQIAPEVLGISL